MKITESCSFASYCKYQNKTVKQKLQITIWFEGVHGDPYFNIKICKDYIYKIKFNAYFDQIEKDKAEQKKKKLSKKKKKDVKKYQDYDDICNAIEYYSDSDCYDVMSCWNDDHDFGGIYPNRSQKTKEINVTDPATKRTITIDNLQDLPKNCPIPILIETAGIYKIHIDNAKLIDKE